MSKVKTKSPQPSPQPGQTPSGRPAPLPYIAQDFTTAPWPGHKTSVPATELGLEDNDRPFFLLDDFPSNRRGFKYQTAQARPSYSALRYESCELSPFNMRLSRAARSPQAALDDSCMAVTTTKGFRSARANVCIREGTWYFEVKILHANEPGRNCHVRLGLARREASLEAPVGSDAYSYGIRDIDGERIHRARPARFLDQHLRSGDVVGFEVAIPRRVRDYSSQYQSSPQAVSHPIPPVPTVLRDRIAVRYKGTLYYEGLEYMSTRAMEELVAARPGGNTNPVANSKKVRPVAIEGSYIKVYVNGEDRGTAFEGLYEFLPPHSKSAAHLGGKHDDDGQTGYYPTISVFRGGMAELVAEPQHVPSGCRPLSERYDETVAEDIVYDIVDEVVLEQEIRV